MLLNIIFQLDALKTLWKLDAVAPIELVMYMWVMWGSSIFLIVFFLISCSVWEMSCGNTLNLTVLLNVYREDTINIKHLKIFTQILLGINATNIKAVRNIGIVSLDEMGRDEWIFRVGWKLIVQIQFKSLSNNIDYEKKNQ